MTTSITTIQSSDLITNSRADINNNFSSLNSNKIETSVIDTDTTLAANSDSKIPTQKAVKAYVDSGGNPNASETVRGIVEEATDAEVTAGTATGSTGAKLFVTPAKLATRTTAVLASYQTTVIYKVGSTTYDIATASGTQNIAHGLGTIPKIVRIRGVIGDNNSAIVFSEANTTYNGTTQTSNFVIVATGFALTGNTFKLSSDSGSKYQVGVVTFDTTNIIITWTKTSTPTGTIYLSWEAQA